MSKRKAPDTTDSQGDASDQSQAGDAKESVLWTVGKPTTWDYYYDRVYPKHALKKNEPLRNS